MPVLSTRLAFLAAVAVAGVAAGLATVVVTGVPAWEALLFAATAAGLERMGTHSFGRVRISASPVGVIAAAIATGPAGAALAALAVAVASFVGRGRPLSRLAFNTGQLQLAAAAAALAFQGVDALVPGAGGAIVAAATAGLVMWFVPSVLVSAMVALDDDAPVLVVYRRNFDWLPVHYGVAGVVGLALVESWEQSGALGFAAFTLPALGIVLSLRQGLDKARRAMREVDEAEAHSATLEQLLAERDALNAQLEHQALHDPLTGLPNRVLCFDRIAQATRNGEPLALMFIDLDRFKAVNDHHGHAGGDFLLQVIAERLRDAVGPRDTVARLGGDEFVVLARGHARAAEAVADRLLQIVSQPVEYAGQTIHPGASIGVVSPERGDVEPDVLLRRADAALYRAKAGGRNRVVRSHTAADATETRRERIEQDLAGAIERRQFRLEYQPLVELDTHAILGFEALLRWDHDELGEVGPDEFIPIAEASGQIVGIGEWVLRRACQRAASWGRMGDGRWPSVNVNVSPLELTAPGFVHRVASVLEETRLASSRLMVEITEHALVEDLELAERVLSELKAIGVRVALDDFGTGYSAMSYLHRLPVDKIKLDRSFVPELARDVRLHSVVAALHQVARALGVDVVAEGIESAEDVAALRKMGCNVGQGFHLARPMSGAATLEVVERAARRRALRPAA